MVVKGGMIDRDKLIEYLRKRAHQWELLSQSTEQVAEADQDLGMRAIEFSRATEYAARAGVLLQVCLDLIDGVAP
jgi:hypothetical protein